MQQHLCSCCQEVWLLPHFSYCSDCRDRVKARETPLEKLQKKVFMLEKRINKLEKNNDSKT